MAKRVITDLTISHLSGVDLPAQEGATVRTIKNAPGARAMDKDAEIADLKKKLAKQTALAGMDDAQRAFMRGLDADEREEFVGKSAGERAKQIKDHEAADPVVYTSTRTGKSYRRSQQDVADAIKEADEARADRDEVSKAAKGERIAKTVADLGNLSNDGDGLTAVVEAIDGISDATKKAKALQVLKAANDSAGGQTAVAGVNGVTNKNLGQGKGQVAKVAAAREAYEAHVEELAKKWSLSKAETIVQAVEKKERKFLQLQKAWRDAQKGEN